MWLVWAVGGASGADEAEPGAELEAVDAAEVPRGSFSVGAGVAVGAIGERRFPVWNLAAGIGYELGRQRRFSAVMDFDIQASEAYVSERASVGVRTRIPAGRFELTAGPDLWMSTLLVDGDEAVPPSPGASWTTELTFDLGRRWAVYTGAELGRGLSPAWLPVGGLPVTHASGWVGVRLPVGVGIGVGIQRMGAVGTGVTTIGAAF
jgi:hypothetical protein